MPETTNKCKHPSCNCHVAADESYCSRYCHDASDTTEITCNCGHTSCAVTAVQATLSSSRQA
jgi:hypothetical protein